ncbi:MAG: hypothetical protein IPO06_25325 [Leptospiraceae bacterium]|nr:hypothetical protein [Leptospiraceae bacterium]
METVSNFEFLKHDYPDLFQWGKEIERCYSFDEDSAKIKCRIFIEVLTLNVIEYLTGNKSDFIGHDLASRIGFLRDNLHSDFKKYIPVFYEIKDAGNDAAHPEKRNRNVKTEDIIQKTYILSVKFYNQFKNKKLPIKQFHFQKNLTYN